MNGLAEDSLEQSPAQVWGLRIGLGLAGLGLMLLLYWGIRHLLNGVSTPKHQVARIAILPDLPPPPPPPPPKEEKKPEPEEKPKQVPDAPKPVDKPPEPQQLKMEGPAGDAPSPFAGGEVKSDYIGGDVGNGGGDRYAAYAGRVAEQIQEELSRHNLKGSGGKVLLWLSADGSVQRFKLISSSGNAEAIQTALSEIHHLREAPPADMPMPVGLDVSAR